MLNTVVYIGAQTTNGITCAVGAGTSAINGTEQTIANAETAPSGVSFSTATTRQTGVALGNIPAGQHKAFWIRRVVGAATAANNHSPQFAVYYESNP